MARLLDRLNASNSTGLAFQRLWQRTCEQIESQFDSIAAIDAAQQDQLDAVTQVQADLAAQLAQILTVIRNDAITSSYTAPGTTLSASDAGTDATITIAGHTRIYGDISDVPVTGDEITGLDYATTYYVYYDDLARSGHAVTYQATTNVNTALPTKAAGRHYVGKVLTPASGGTATSGGTAPPSGGGGVNRDEINSTL